MKYVNRLLMGMVLAGAAHAAFAADAKLLPNEKEWQAAIEKLSQSADPKLAANKRAVMESERAMAVAVLYGDVEPVMKYISPNYVQHDPTVPAGREGLREFFKAGAFHGKREPGQPLPEIAPPSFLFAEGDIVGLIFELKMPDPKDPKKTITSTPVTAFRVIDGKLVEHFGGGMGSMGNGGPLKKP